MSRYSYYSDSTGSNVLLGVQVLILGGVFLVLGLRGCSKINSNRDIIDTEKNFNFIIDYQGEGTSIVRIDQYSDYTGQTVEYKTQDGLDILTGLHDAELIHANSFDTAYNIALKMSNNKKENVNSYDQNMNLNTTIDPAEGWNRNFLNLNYDFNYAISEEPYGVRVDEISTWKDWDDDDKIQYVDKDGVIHLSTFDNTKLVNEDSSSLEAVYQYALSLAGSEDRLYGDVDKENGRVLKLIKTTEEE